MTMQMTGDRTQTVELPAPTATPLVCAFGVALFFAGMATSAIMGAIGAALALAGGLGWLRQVLPHAAHVAVPVVEADITIATTRREIEQAPGIGGQVRATLPLEVYPISAGIGGGIVGGIAMGVLAIVYGIASGHGPWYPINLLAAGFFPLATIAEMSAFHAAAFVIALAIHAVTSILVGALYGALLPMLPRRPVLLGGLIAPLTWSGLLYTSLALINPVLAERIDWLWFLLTQLAFGVVAGLVVARRARIATLQPLPWTMRAGLEATGLRHGSPDKGDEHA